SQIYLVDNEQIGTGDAGATLARYFFTSRDVDHIDRQVRQLGAEGCRKIIAAGFDKAQFCMRESPVHVCNSGEVHGSILPDRRMRTATSLDAHDALRRQRLGTRQNELIFPRVNVVRNYIEVIVVPESLAQRLNQRRFSRADRTADSDAQRTVMRGAYADLRLRAGSKSHERNSLVYCVSCAMEARSTMNPTDPRSSTVAVLASALAAS